MSAKAVLLCVLAACPGLARADRTPLLVLAHAADAGPAPGPEGSESLISVVRSAERAIAANQTVSHDASAEVDPFQADSVEDDTEPVEGSLDYKALDGWRTEASGQVDGVVSEEKGALDPAATEGLKKAEEYAKMLNGLGNGFDTFKAAVGDFRAANKGLQGRQNEDVREMLKSTRVESGATANAIEVEPDGRETPKVEPEVKHEVVPEVKHEVEPEVKHPVVHQEATTLSESDVADVSHEAEKLTGHAENEAVEEDAVEAGSVVREETSQETKKALTTLEEQLKNGELTDDAQASGQAVQNLVDEEEAQQTRVTTACYALADSPLKGDKRKCNSDVVKGMFEEKVCEGHESDLEAACNAASKCQAKHVCVKDGAVVADADGSWEVNDNPTCEAGDAKAEKVCVPKAGDFKLPVAA